MTLCTTWQSLLVSWRSFVHASLVQGVQLKSGPYFNISNLFTKIYNMLYYTTNLYLQQVLEMMFEYLAVSLVLTLTSADYDSCPKVNLFYEIFS